MLLKTFVTATWSHILHLNDSLNFNVKPHERRQQPAGNIAQAGSFFIGKSQRREKLTLTRPKLDLNSSVTLSFDLSTQTFGILQNSISYSNGLYQSSRYNYQDEDRVIGANLLHLSKTFHAWINDDPEIKVRVFDRSYPDFAAEVGKYLGFEGTTAELKPGISLHLPPDAAHAGVGKVKFVAADPQAFIRRDAAGNEIRNTVLGCKDLECLNRGGVHYQLFGSTLSIGSGPLTGFEYGEEFYEIKFKEWPPEK